MQRFLNAEDKLDPPLPLVSPSLEVACDLGGSSLQPAASVITGTPPTKTARHLLHRVAFPIDSSFVACNQGTMYPTFS